MNSTNQPAYIAPTDPPDSFPPDLAALPVPNGLIAIGGDLSPERLLAAYRRGIFPWYEQGQPILWWTPNPRLIIEPRQFHVSRRLRRKLRNSPFEIRVDTAFEQVIEACAQPRTHGAGTWITPEMQRAYCRLAVLGYAHSVETWREGALVGGVYGVALGAAFFGESMFSRVTDASKVALRALCEQLLPYPHSLLDGQVPSRHLLSLGGTLLAREAFVRRLRTAVAAPGPWEPTR